MACLKHALAVLLLLPCLVGAGLAEEHRHHRDRKAGASAAGWHAEIGRSHHHGDQARHEGRWHHGHHEGRHGWWWIVGGAWHFHPARVETYRDPYRSPVVVVAPAPARYWYYCSNPAGYYPYVARCALNWQRVSAAAPLR